VDKHEPEEMAQALINRGLKVDRQVLPIGDYLFSDICIERKTVKDFLFSMYSNRLWDQIKDLRANYPRSFVMVVDTIGEAFMDRHARGKEVPFWGSIAGMWLGWQMPIITPPNVTHAAILISQMYIKENRHEPYLKPVERKGDTLEERMENSIAACGEGIGRKKAQFLLGQYHTLQSLVESVVQKTVVLPKGVSSKDLEKLHEIYTADWTILQSKRKERREAHQGSHP